jgi:hypothetical protein
LFLYACLSNTCILCRLDTRPSVSLPSLPSLPSLAAGTHPGRCPPFPRSDGPVGPADANVSSSSQVPKLEKAKLKRQKREKNSTLVQEITGHWEQLRQTSTAKEKKVELVGKILDACGDRLGDVAASHTASRIIQSCVKHGDAGQRERVQEAVLGSGRGVVELSKNPYSRFVVSKLIMTASKGQLGGAWLDCFGDPGCLSSSAVAVCRPVNVQYCVIFLRRLPHCGQLAV